MLKETKTEETYVFLSHFYHCWHFQGRREPNVGPRPAKILRIFGFANSKTDGENATVLSEF